MWLAVCAGALDAVVSGLLTPVRRERLKMHPVDIPEILHWLCRVSVNPCIVTADSFKTTTVA
jgi:hypothetical protein